MATKSTKRPWTKNQLLHWTDLTSELKVSDLRSLILLALSRHLTLGVYAVKWRIAWGRSVYDDEGHFDHDKTEDDEDYTGFLELPDRILGSLLGAESVDICELHRDEYTFTKIEGRFIGDVLHLGSIKVSRDELCGRLGRSTSAEQFSPVGPEHTAKKEEGDGRLIAVLVEMYLREKKKVKPVAYENKLGLQARVVADIEDVRENEKLDKKYLSSTTLKEKIGRALAKFPELKQ